MGHCQALSRPEFSNLGHYYTNMIMSLHVHHVLFTMITDPFTFDCIEPVKGHCVVGLCSM